MNLLYNTKGAIGILTTLLFSTALVWIAVNTALLSISSRSQAFHENQSSLLFITAEACAEEALIQLKRDPDYAGGNLAIGGVPCVAMVNGDDPKDILISVSKNNFTRTLFLRVQLDPVFDIIEWTD